VGCSNRSDKVSKGPVNLDTTKRCAISLTVGRWTWKPSSDKECVTAHQPRDSALKMDGAKTGKELIPGQGRQEKKKKAPLSRRT